MSEVVITGMARTPIGKLNGGFKDVPAHRLGACAIEAALLRAGVEPDHVQEVVMGCVGEVGPDAFNARLCSLSAGLPTSVPAYNVNRLCSSGLQAIWNGAKDILSGECDTVVAGGDESMSRQPYLDYEGRQSKGLGNRVLVDGTLSLLTDPWGEYPMGMTAEIVAERYSIGRQRQDDYALGSQERAATAVRKHAFEAQIAPCEGTSLDEHPRSTSPEKLANLQPVFKEGGTVTAGNSAGINDGAAVVVLERRDLAEKRGAALLAKFVGCAAFAVEPEVMGVAPAFAIPKILSRVQLKLDEMDVIELNEAFAAQVLAVVDQLEISDNDPRLNPDGGAIALGHPIGATGAVLVVKALDYLDRTDGRYAMVSMCVGGGQGLAAIFERF